MQFRAKGDGSGKDYIRLKDGDAVTGVFAGDPFEYKDHFKLGECQGEGCPHCRAGSKPSFKFKLNFIMKEDGKYVAKIFQQGWTVYEKLASLSEEFDLAKKVVKVKRKGTGKDDTFYDVIALSDVTTEQASAFDSIHLHEFGKKQEKAEPVYTPASDEPGDFDEDQDLPF